MKIYKSKKSGLTGFTLIELLVVASLTALLMLAASSVFMTFMIGSAKIRLSQKIRTQGNLALEQIQFLLRNTTQVTDNELGDVCLDSMSQIALLSLDGSKTIIKTQDDGGIDKITLVTGTVASPIYSFLTADLADVSNLEFKCYTGEDSTNYVEVSFQLSKGVVPNPGSFSETFKTGVTIRNY
jgi:prepilin-type N-terminal cleavage/methylation domain-containing protein